MTKLFVSISCGVLAVSSVGLLANTSSRAIADIVAGTAVQVVNDSTSPVPTTITNTPDVHVTNQPTVDAVPPADSAIVTYTVDNVPLNQAFTTDVNFGSLVANLDERLIIDYVSIDGAVAPNQRMWATILPCTEKGNFGRAAVPLQFGGSVYNGNTKVNDVFSGTVAMHGYVDPGCTTVVRVFRGPTAGLGHAHVTIQGHRGKRIIPRS